MSLCSASRPLGRVSEERQISSRDLWGFPLFWIPWSRGSAAPKPCLESGVSREDEELCPKERAQSSCDCVLFSLELIPKHEEFPRNLISKGLSCTQGEAVPLCRCRQRPQLCRIFIFPPNLLLIVIKTKQFPSPSSLHRAGILATCPVAHSQPKATWFPKFCSLEWSEFWVKRV